MAEAKGHETIEVPEGRRVVVKIEAPKVSGRGEHDESQQRLHGGFRLGRGGGVDLPVLKTSEGSNAAPCAARYTPSGVCEQADITRGRRGEEGTGVCFYAARALARQGEEGGVGFLPTTNLHQLCFCTQEFNPRLCIWNPAPTCRAGCRLSSPPSNLHKHNLNPNLRLHLTRNPRRPSPFPPAASPFRQPAPRTRSASRQRTPPEDGNANAAGSLAQ